MQTFKVSMFGILQTVETKCNKWGSEIASPRKMLTVVKIKREAVDINA